MRVESKIDASLGECTYTMDTMTSAEWKNESAKIVEPTKTQFNRQTYQTSQTPMQSQSVASISDDNLRAKIQKIRRIGRMKEMKLKEDDLRARIQKIRHMKEMKLKENHAVLKIHVGRVAKHKRTKAPVAPNKTGTEAPIPALATALSTEKSKLFYR